MSHARIIFTGESRYFQTGVSYGVSTWRDGCPWVVNDLGSKTWLLEPSDWTPVAEPMTIERSQRMLHANEMARRERWA